MYEHRVTQIVSTLSHILILTPIVAHLGTIQMNYTNTYYLSLRSQTQSTGLTLYMVDLTLGVSAYHYISPLSVLQRIQWRAADDKFAERKIQYHCWAIFYLLYLWISPDFERMRSLESWPLWCYNNLFRGHTIHNSYRGLGSWTSAYLVNYALGFISVFHWDSKDLHEHWKYNLFFSGHLFRITI